MVLDALEKDKEIEKEIGDAGMFSGKIFELIMDIANVLSLRESKSQSRNGSLTQGSTIASAGGVNKHAKLPRLS